MLKVVLDKTMPAQILVVEDEPALVDTLAFNLDKESHILEIFSFPKSGGGISVVAVLQLMFMFDGCVKKLSWISIDQLGY